MPSWFFSSQHHQQQALQWWQQRQRDRLHHGAELIREGVLQELFVLRRQMEVAHYNNQPVSPDHLQQLETLHNQLKQLGHELSPTFSKDSLPLAIQGILLQWRSPQRQIESIMHSSAVALNGTTIKNDLLDDSLEAESLSASSSALTSDEAVHPIVVTVLEEWLQLVTVQLSTDAVIGVELLSHDNQGDLTLRLQEPDDGQRQAIAHLQEVSYLRQAFEVLVDGRTTHHHHDSHLEWQFLWSLGRDSAPEVTTVNHGGL